MDKQIGRCGWCGHINQGSCGCPAEAEIKRLRAALTKIARWHGEFPATGKFWDDEKTRPTSFASEYGSNGERDFMRQRALEALGPNVVANRPIAAGWYLG